MAAGLIAALALAGCGSGRAKRTIPSKGGPILVGPAGPPSPALRRLRAELGRLMRRAGPGSGAVVYDLHEDVRLYSLRDGIKRAPASVEKLYTTVALLKRLGPGARLRTLVLGTGHLAGGVWHGNLYLRGGGDPTLGDGSFNRVWNDGNGPSLQQLATQLIGDRIHSVSGSVIADASALDGDPGGPASGYAPDVSDYGGQLSALTYDHGASGAGLGPAAFAARELALVLRAAHVQATASPSTGRAPGGAHRLASVSSPRMSVLIRLMDLRSDDLFAELLTKRLGAHSGSPGTLAAGARVIEKVLAAYGIHPRVLDGSGLSRHDRSSPREVVDLLRAVWGQSAGNTLERSLPVVGVSGTARHIGVGSAAQGRCVAKTGTLDSVTNLAGYCHSRGGHVLAFALFIDGPSNEVALKLIGQMTAAIARY